MHHQNAPRRSWSHYRKNAVTVLAATVPAVRSSPFDTRRPDTCDRMRSAAPGCVGEACLDARSLDHMYPRKVMTGTLMTSLKVVSRQSHAKHDGHGARHTRCGNPKTT
jgi:hypothetical protein